MDTEGEKLRRYIGRLPHGQKYRFLAKVAEECDLTMPAVVRWSASKCAIRRIYKEKIEDIAGEKIFDK